MDEIIKYLKDKKFDEYLEHAISVTPKLFGKKFDKDVINESVKHALHGLMNDDETFRNMFFKYYLNKGLEEIVERLDLKYDYSEEPDKDDLLAAIMTLVSKL